MILISKHIVPRGYLGITIFPFMILKSKDLRGNSELVNHEKIHLRQQIELLIVPFYIIYIIEFLIRLIQYKNRQLAYMNISFEREAYAKEEDFGYLKSRPFFNFKSYL